MTKLIISNLCLILFTLYMFCFQKIFQLQIHFNSEIKQCINSFFHTVAAQLFLINAEMLKKSSFHNPKIRNLFMNCNLCLGRHKQKVCACRSTDSYIFLFLFFFFFRKNHSNIFQINI